MKSKKEEKTLIEDESKRVVNKKKGKKKAPKKDATEADIPNLVVSPGVLQLRYCLQEVAYSSWATLLSSTVEQVQSRILIVSYNTALYGSVDHPVIRNLTKNFNSKIIVQKKEDKDEDAEGDDKKKEKKKDEKKDADKKDEKTDKEKDPDKVGLSR